MSSRLRCAFSMASGICKVYVYKLLDFVLDVWYRLYTEDGRVLCGSEEVGLYDFENGWKCHKKCFFTVKVEKHFEGGEKTYSIKGEGK